MRRRRIKLLSPLGKGGFGAVYLADVSTPDGLVQRLAVKLLHESWAGDASITARARDEARLMSQLNHDNILKIYGLTRLSDRAAVLMEYVEGIDCRTLVIAGARAAPRGLPPRVAGAIIERAAGGLAAAWSGLSPQTGQPLRVVHRDIKPSNLLISVNGSVKVMDFGVARAEFEREALTGSVQFGTHRYMAPERWLKGAADHPSDVYSLGITFWELLTGVRFERLPLDPLVYEEKLEQQLERLARTPLDGAGLSAVSALLRDMLAYDEAARIGAAGVEERLGAIEPLLPGTGLRRHARQVVPGLVADQLARLREDPALLDLTGTLLVEAPVGGVEAVGGAGEGVSPPPRAVSALTVGLPGPLEPLPPITAQPTATPSSAPTRPISMGQVMITSSAPQPPNLSASVTIPAHRDRTLAYTAALGLTALLGAGVVGWFELSVGEEDAALPPVVLSSLAPASGAAEAARAPDGPAPAAEPEAASGAVDGGALSEGTEPPVPGSAVAGATASGTSADTARGDAAAGSALAADPPVSGAGLAASALAGAEDAVSAGGAAGGTAEGVAGDAAGGAAEGVVGGGTAGGGTAGDAAGDAVSGGTAADTAEGAAGGAGAGDAVSAGGAAGGTAEREGAAEEYPAGGEGAAEGADSGGRRERALDALRTSLEAGDPAIRAPEPLTVTLKLIADPREGSFTIGGQTTGVGAITLAEGHYQLDYVGPDWSRSCAVEVHSGLSRIKVSRELPGCQVY